jgi:heterodisulfide reductase subunit A-like polyferredoxin
MITTPLSHSRALRPCYANLKGVASQHAHVHAASKTAVVIGGGIGGLVVAGRLARSGLSVTLLEKNAEVSQTLQKHQSTNLQGW